MNTLHLIGVAAGYVAMILLICRVVQERRHRGEASRRQDAQDGSVR